MGTKAQMEAALAAAQAKIDAMAASEHARKVKEHFRGDSITGYVFKTETVTAKELEIIQRTLEGKKLTKAQEDALADGAETGANPATVDFVVACAKDMKARV